MVITIAIGIAVSPLPSPTSGEAMAPKIKDTIPSNPDALPAEFGWR